MSVISLIITQSSAETISGIPNSITISSNIPAIIFYTLDGTQPNTSSPIYIEPILLPSSLPNITLNIFATNGTDSSSIISNTYTADLASIINITSTGSRYPQSTTSNVGIEANINQYPFGSNAQNSNVKYTGIGNPDNTILNQALPSSPNAFDENKNPASFSNKPLDPFANKPLDRNVNVIGKNSPVEYTQEFSSNNDKLFNPKAMVVFHDANNTDPLTPQIINRPYFSLENPELRDGILLSTTALNTPSITGSFIRTVHNTTTGKSKSYYRDGNTNRWIISEYDYAPTNPNAGSLGGLVFGREQGSQFVYPWHLWQRRTLP